ncbi:4-hydroxyphenylacetate degradation bifunctional isomerase [Pseudomonas putida]|uniref:4-hydroxyphenylacetate degradation bifunctional isomerase n=1 Tax=Pseudomonas putida TaxID=303 RepID=A0A1L7NF08_PSEPU|nr:4-hydroxyphenylacetate degradation bifunctional isomerase [Pseudomonas putida]
MRRPASDIATGTLFGIALNYQGLFDSRLAEFNEPPCQMKWW